MERRTGEKQKINVIDILIILIVVACIAAIAVRFYFGSDVSLTEDTALVKFEVCGISEENAREFARDKKIYLQSNDTEIGYFKSVSESPLMIDAVDGDGNITKAAHPDKKTVSGYVFVFGKWSERGFFVNGTDLISIGSQISVYTDRNQFSMTVISVEKAD